MYHVAPESNALIGGLSSILIIDLQRPHLHGGEKLEELAPVCDGFRGHAH